LKKEDIEGVLLTPLRILQTRAAFIAPFTSEELDDNQKMFFPQLAIDNDSFHSAFVNPCMM
jgi:hypothetical protein